MLGERGEGPEESAREAGRRWRRLRLPRALWRGGLVVGFTLATVVLLSASAQDDDSEPTFVVETAIDGLSLPTNLQFAPDDRVFVTEKAGRVLAFDDLDDPSPTTVVDLGGNIHNYEDRGLLGLEVDPAFPSRPYLYVLYTLDRDDSWGDECPDPPGAVKDGCVVNGRLSRLTVDESSELVGEEEVLLEDVWCGQFPSHSVGDLEFMADGSLLVSAGEGSDYNGVDYGQNGGSAGSPTPANPCGDPPRPVGEAHTLPGAQGGALRSQALVTPDPTHVYNGTVLRIDPDTAEAHPTNPLADGDDEMARRIVAHGLRNPYRIAARPGTSEAWVVDVGWGAWEELNRIADVEDPTVENFGWPCYEGPDPEPNYAGLNLDICNGLYDGSLPSAVTEPSFAYQHADPLGPEACGVEAGSGAVSAIEFYEEGSYPSVYDGAVFFGDYVRGCLWSIGLDDDGEPDPGQIRTVAADVTPVDLATGPDGDLYSVDIGAGEIQHLVFQGDDSGPPTAVVDTSTDNGPLPLEVSFDGTDSSANMSGDLTYDWDLTGDGVFDDSSEPQPTHTYTQAGPVTVGLRVTDDDDQTATTEVVVHPGNTRPEPVIESPDEEDEWDVDEVLALEGRATDPEDGELGPDGFEWQVDLHHCATPDDCHVHFLHTVTGEDSTTIVAPNHEYPAYLELTLTVTDSDGLTGSTSQRISPRTVDVTFESDPADLEISVASQALVTPATETLIANSRHTVTAISPQEIDGETYVFDSWADGVEDRVREITVTDPTTYTATYVPEDP